MIEIMLLYLFIAYFLLFVCILIHMVVYISFSYLIARSNKRVQKRKKKKYSKWRKKIIKKVKGEKPNET